MPAIQSAKADLRDVMRRRRRALAQAAGAAGETVARIVTERALVGSDDVVSLYWPMVEEMDARPLIEILLRMDRRVVLPVTPKVGKPLVFRQYARDVTLQPGPFGTSEPPPAAPAMDPTVLFLPLLAFDSAGRRLGYGAGYYDRTLDKLRQAGAVKAYGLAFAGQEVERTPTDALDQPLDGVVTERGFRHFPTD